MNYNAAIIGCHGVGKTTLINKLSKQGYTIFQEIAMNNFMRNDHFLSEIKIIVDNILLNKEISKATGNVISDRFAFLDAIIYSETFYKMGWINLTQLKTIYSIINDSNHNWNYPNKLLVMTDSKELIKKNIIKRNRNEQFKETDEKFLKTTLEMFNNFYNKTINFQFLKKEIVEKIDSIPKYKIKCHEQVSDVLNILNK